MESPKRFISNRSDFFYSLKGFCLKVIKLKIIDQIHTLNQAGLRENKPKYIVVHSARVYPEFEDVLRKHKHNGWAGVGYHLFISDSDIVSQARPFNKEGAHALGYNCNSIGLCVYSPTGELTSDKVNLVKRVLQHLREEQGELLVISHTRAQVKYINDLLAENGFDIRFNDKEEIVKEINFQQLKSELDTFVGGLSNSYFDLKQNIKTLVNCPGEMYYLVTK